MSLLNNWGVKEGKTFLQDTERAILGLKKKIQVFYIAPLSVSQIFKLSHTFI